MMISLKRIFRAQALSVALFAVAFAILDLSLSLGPLHGVVFSLYLLYLSILVLLANLIVMIVLLFRKRRSQAMSFLKMGLVLGLCAAIVAFSAGLLIP